MEFSDKIKYLREENKLTLQDIADKVGVSKPTVQRWESGEIKNLRKDKIKALAQALNTSPAYLMDWDSEDKHAPLMTDETEEFLDLLHKRDEIKMLFSVAKNATKEDVEMAANIIEALIKKQHNND